MQSKNIKLAENVEREVKFTNASLFYFQKEYGESFFQYVAQIEQGDHIPGHLDVTYLVWAGMIHKNRALELEEVMDLIDPSFIYDIWVDLQDVIYEAMPNVGKETEKKKPTGQKKQTSKTSKSKSSGQKKG